MCPSCGQAESVYAVPGIYESARASEETIARARRAVNDNDASRSRKQAARMQIAATPPPVVRSALLAPAPTSRVGSFVGGAVFFALPAAGLRLMYQSSESFANSTGMVEARDGDGTLLTISVICTAVSAICLFGMALALMRRRRVNAGRAAADAVWRRGWYCTRCAVVHFRPGEEPAGVDARRPLDPESFRNLVWAAGGYGGRQRDMSGHQAGSPQAGAGGAGEAA